MARKSFKRPNSALESEGMNEWLNTYADMLTLLLCFFVMIIVISEPKMDKLEELTEGFSSGFVSDMIELPFKTVYEDFQLIIDDYAVELDVAAELTDRGVRLDLGTNMLFNPGSATFKQDAIPMLQEMIFAIREMDIETPRIEVEGHTDDNPIKGGNFATNWQLSAMRAANITQLLIEQGIDPKMLQMAAFAEYRPKVSNRDVEGNSIADNQALNRRIVLHIMRYNAFDNN